MARQWIRVEIENGGTEFEEVAKVTDFKEGDWVIRNGKPMKIWARDLPVVGHYGAVITPKRPAHVKLAEAVLEAYRGIRPPIESELADLAKQVLAESQTP